MSHSRRFWLVRQALPANIPGCPVTDRGFVNDISLLSLEAAVRAPIAAGDMALQLQLGQGGENMVRFPVTDDIVERRGLKGDRFQQFVLGRRQTRAAAAFVGRAHFSRSRQMPPEQFKRLDDIGGAGYQTGPLLQ